MIAGWSTCSSSENSWSKAFSWINHWLFFHRTDQVQCTYVLQTNFSLSSFWGICLLSAFIFLRWLKFWKRIYFS